jgi:hypothetical protein
MQHRASIGIVIGMWLDLLMLLLLVGLFALCAALVRFAEDVVGPKNE